MPDRAATAAMIHDALASLWPGRFGPGRPAEDVSLGEEGLGLDSIEIVELVIECEKRAGRGASGAEELLEAGPVSVGLLIDHLARG